jgi:hypothetical protein
MKRTRFAVAGVMAGSLLFTAFAQEGTEPKAPPTVPEILTRAGASYGAGHYSTCMSEIREANRRVMADRTRLVRAALPGSSAGLEKIPAGEPSTTDMLAMSRAEIAASTLGMVVTQRYGGQGKSMRVTVTVDSPFLQANGMDEALSKQLDKNPGAVQYGKYKAILSDKGSGSLDLELLIETSMIKVESLGLTRDELLAFIDQKAVDALAAAVAK